MYFLIPGDLLLIMIRNPAGYAYGIQSPLACFIFNYEELTGLPVHARLAFSKGLITSAALNEVVVIPRRISVERRLVPI